MINKSLKKGFAVAWLTVTIGSLLTLCGAMIYNLYQTNEVFREFSHVMVLVGTVVGFMYITMWAATTVFTKGSGD